MSENKTKSNAPKILSVDDTWTHFVSGAQSVDSNITSSVTKDKFGFTVRKVTIGTEEWELHCIRSNDYFQLFDPKHVADADYNFKFGQCKTTADAEGFGKAFVQFATRPERDAESSIEAVIPADIKAKRAKIESMIYETMQIVDPSGDNTKRWQNLFGGMDDKQFTVFMDHLKKGECQLNVVMPNMKKVPKVPNLVKAAEKVGLKLAHRLWLPDKTRPGKKYLTNEEYLVLELPIRRAQQEWDKKLQVPSRDTHVDALTGQVIMDDKACHLSTPEIQSLSTRGLTATLQELVRVRGGDINAYGDFKRQLEESGEASMKSLDPRTRARASVLSHILLQSMMIDNNL